MSTFADPPFSGTPRAEVLELIDGWAAEVLTLRTDALGVNRDSSSWRRQLDDLFGTYKVRDRVSRLSGADELLVVRALDELFITATDVVGRSWLELTGMADDAGPGWWWERLPVSGAAREDYERALRYQQRAQEVGGDESGG